MVQWLRYTSRGVGSIPGQETKILYRMQCGQKNKRGHRLKVTHKDLHFGGILRNVFKAFKLKSLAKNV